MSMEISHLTHRWSRRRLGQNSASAFQVLSAYSTEQPRESSLGRPWPLGCWAPPRRALINWRSDGATGYMHKGLPWLAATMALFAGSLPADRSHPHIPGGHLACSTSPPESWPAGAVVENTALTLPCEKRSRAAMWPRRLCAVVEGRGEGASPGGYW